MTASGFYHCSVKPVGRSNGRSIVAAAAYRSGERLEDERTGETFDYRARGGVVDTFILTRDGAAWGENRERLWNGAEEAEPRANGRLATELELALPCELDAAAHKRLLKDYLAPIIEKYGVAADVAIHAPGKEGDHRNTHAHVLVTHRELGPDGFGDIANRRTIKKKVKGQEKQIEIAGIAATPADIKALRRDWEHAVNREYERAGLDIRVDHRSHEDRGIAQEPTQHVGPTATGMERRGEATERGDVNREITQRNSTREAVAALEAQAAAIKAELASITHYDRDATDAAWMDAVAAAAIAKDEAAQEARQRSALDKAADQDRPAARGSYAPLETPEPPPAPKPERELSGTAAQIRAAWALSETASQLEDALAAHGISLAAVAPDEAYASERRAAFAKEIGNYVAPWREGEIVAVDGRGTVYRLNERTTGDERGEIEGRLVGVDRAALMNVADTQEAMRAAAWAAARSERQAEREQARPASAIEAAVADALTSTMTGTDFAAALDEKGLTVARVNAADAHALEKMRNRDIEAGTTGDLASGRIFAHVLEGDFAAVTRQGDVFRLSPQKLDLEDIEQRLADVQTSLPSVMKAREHIEEVREAKAEQRAEREADFIASRLEQADAFAGKQELGQATRAAETVVHAAFETPVAAAAEAINVAGGFLGGAAKIVAEIGDFLGGLFGGPKPTPQQAKEILQASGNEETLHARDYAATVQAKEAEFDDRMHAQKTSQQQEDLSFAARYGTPPTREASLGREHDHERERERDE